MPTEKTTDAIAVIFSRHYPFITHNYMVLKDIQVGTKLTRWLTIIQIAVNSSNSKTSMLILLKMICNI